MKKTALYDIHEKLNAKIVNFHNYLLPIFYTSIQEEHLAVRNNAGFFDVSHMGNLILKFENRDKAISFLNYTFTNDFSKIYPGKCIYANILNYNGGVIDDIIVMCINDNNYHIVVNSVNIEKDYTWLMENSKNKNILIENKSDFYSIIALQGPSSTLILNKLFNFPVNNLKSFHVIEYNYNNNKILISKTGYTGESGFELILDKKSAILLTEKIIQNKKKYNITPCGLGARDTLRIEAALPLYGHELDANHSPLQTNIAWSVKLKKDDFIGKNAILDNNKYKDKLIGFELLGKAIPRENMNIIDKNNNQIGYVTSGTFSPFYKKSIGLGYINPDFLNENELFLEIRNRTEKIKIVDLPFYKR